jgi:2-methylthioadenine synthetase
VLRWREICPDITVRSTFIVGFPGETDAEFEAMLDFLDAAQLDRVGAFAYSPVEGAAANALPDPVPEAVKQERLARFMEKQAQISAAKLEAKIGSVQQCLVDVIEDGIAVARSKADAPEIDGLVHIQNAEEMKLQVGQFVDVEITDSDEHDLFGDALPATAPASRKLDLAVL